MAEQTRQDRIIDGLSRLMVFQKSLMKAESEDAFYFELVNNSRTILSFQHTLALEIRDNKVSVKAVSGVPQFDKRGPLAGNIVDFVKSLPVATKEITLSAIDTNSKQAVGKHLEKWANLEGFYLSQSHGDYTVAMLFFYGRNGTNNEENLATELFDHASIIWDKIKRPKIGFLERLTNSRKKKLTIVAVLIAILLFPMRTSVTADASIAAKDPTVIRSGLNGVIEEVHVENNASVIVGDLLLSFDNSELTNMLKVSNQELKTTEAEMQRVAQLAITNREQREQLQILSQMVETKKAEVALYEDRMSRILITSPSAGVAILTDENELTGKPVSIGEKLMVVANPSTVEIEIFIAVEDALELEPGADVKMFLNVAPQSPLDATLTFTSYRATTTPEGYLAFKAKAELASDEELPRIGLRGTARIYGDRAPIIVQITRKPLAALRQWLGV